MVRKAPGFMSGFCCFMAWFAKKLSLEIWFAKFSSFFVNYLAFQAIYEMPAT